MIIHTLIPEFPLPQDLARFWDFCDLKGVELRLVGGCVRDHLLGIVPHDIDIATSARPEQIMCLGHEAGFSVIPTGIMHGTVTICGAGMRAEITTLRQDVYADGRHALVAFTDDWAVDAARRDFTINALFMDRFGQISDYTNGVKDLENRIVRFIGDPVQRIREDYLRILRFFRFHARFGGEHPDAEGLSACAALRAGLDQLSMERVRDEILRLLAGPRALEMLSIMQQTGILSQIDSRIGNINRLDAIQYDPAFDESVWRFRCLLPDDVENLQSIGRDWRFPGRVIDDWVALARIDLDDIRAFRRALYHGYRQKTGYDVGRCALLLAGRNAQDSLWTEIRDFVPSLLPVSGQDIMAVTGLTGPVVGQIMTNLLDWWLAHNPRPDRATCLDFLASGGQSMQHRLVPN